MILGQPVKLKPTNGLKLRKENGLFLAEDGETVIASSYWLRRKNDGDVEEVADEAVQEPAADQQKPKTKG